MKTSKILYIAAGLMLLSACNSDKLDEFAGRIPINLGYETLTVEEATRTAAATNLNDANIASGRTVRVRISTNNGTSYNDYDYTTAASGVMNPPSTKPYYPTSGNVKIVAYHPSTAGTSFSIQTTQTSDANYNASDLMFSDNITSQAKTTSKVNLQFTHKMAKLVVTVNKGDGVNYIKTIKLMQVKPTVTFNQTTGAVSGLTGTAGYVTIFTGGASGTTTASGAAVIPAQTITGNVLEIETDQGTATYSVPSGKTFNANTKYTVSVTVNRSAIGTTNSITWGNVATAYIQPTVASKTPDGLEAVDLGLPSGVKWANMNVGANTPKESGYYFAWGETDGFILGASNSKYSYDWSHYKWGTSSSLTKYNTSGSTLELSDDAANANWGGDWRMPTKAEIEELINNTNKKYYFDDSGVNGVLLTSKIAGYTNKSIFIPATSVYRDNQLSYNSDGYGFWYWASTLDTPQSADCINFTDNSFWIYSDGRCYGFSVRAVCDSRPLSTVTTADLGKVICSNGHIHTTADAVNCGGIASAMIVYVGSSTGIPGYTRGLAIDLQYAEGYDSYSLRGYIMGALIKDYSGSSYLNHSCNSVASACDYTDGVTYTQKLYNATQSESTNPWFFSAWQVYMANENTPNTHKTYRPRPSNTSRWFVPTVFQCIQMLRSFDSSLSQTNYTSFDYGECHVGPSYYADENMVFHETGYKDDRNEKAKTKRFTTAANNLNAALKACGGENASYFWLSNSVRVFEDERWGTYNNEDYMFIYLNDMFYIEERSYDYDARAFFAF